MPIKNLKYGFLIIACLWGITQHCNVQAQFRAKKGNNLRITNYKGNIRSFSNKRYIAVGLSLKSMNYFGDLAPKSGWASTDFSFTKPGIGITAEYKYAPRLGFFANFAFGSLKGDDFESADPSDTNAKFRYIRNLQFRNRITELSAGARFDILPNRGTYLSRPVLNPYVFGGLAVFHHNPQGLAPAVDQLGNAIPESGKWVNLRPLGTEGQYSSAYNVKPYGAFQISIPIGIGAKYKINNSLDFSFEIGYRILFFDYIDDVSGNYIDLGALNSPLAKAMSDRSQEVKAAVSGKNRDFEGTILPNTSYYTYISSIDGASYTVIAGYGSEFPTNNRGGSDDNDIYFVTSFKLTYVIGGTFRNAKFR
jgi:hypothetical protein